MKSSRAVFVSSLLLSSSLSATSANAAVLAAKFEDTQVIPLPPPAPALATPINVRFDATGKIYVAEKAGRIKRFDALPSPGNGVTLLDITAQVSNYHDRGLIGMALHPDFANKPYVYVLYTYDAPPNQTASKWNDNCGQAGQPHPTNKAAGCVVSGRVARYKLVADALVEETVLIQDEWYQQYPSHSVGDLAFGPDGYLYVSGGDGASYNFADTGAADQVSSLDPNPGDPVNEGGALRSQDLLTSADADGLNGTVLRIDPDTGLPAASNPLFAAGGNRARVVAFGLRQPYRLGFRPNTKELWISEVGWNSWEEVNRIADVTDGAVENFGWPCYEGNGANSGYKDANLCKLLAAGTLGAPGTLQTPHFTYQHGKAPGYAEADTPCVAGTASSIAGIAFYGGGDYPTRYNGALFFADYSVKCLYAMRANATTGVPDPTQIDIIERGANVPVALQIGPGGDVYYASAAGSIRRIRYTGSSPVAVASADVTSGAGPLTVKFDGSASTDPDAQALTYAWDFDNDGDFDDATGVNPTFVFAPGSHLVKLQVTDTDGKTAVSTPISISVNNTPPVATIVTPLVSLKWKANDTISFSGSGTDAQDGTLGDAAFSWKVTLLHCPGGSAGCHQHPLADTTGVKSGSFLADPDGFPSFYEIELTVTDSGGLSDKKTVKIEAIGSSVSFKTTPVDLAVTYAGTDTPTPVTFDEVLNSKVYASAPLSQEKAGSLYWFVKWSDNEPRVREITVPVTPATFTAEYGIDTDRDGVIDTFDLCPNLPAQLAGGGVADGGSQDAGVLPEVDTDQDGVGDRCDNCPTVKNANQADQNKDGIGDLCEGLDAGPVGNDGGLDASLDGSKKDGSTSDGSTSNPSEDDTSGDVGGGGLGCSTQAGKPSSALWLFSLTALFLRRRRARRG